jgi:hypothetical protein
LPPPSSIPDESQQTLAHTFEWRSEYEIAGLARDALYLLRPDTYVALADGSGAADALERYFADRGIQPAGN